MSRIESGNINLGNKLARFALTQATSLLLFKSERKIKTVGMQRTEKLAEDGYTVIMVTNHFGKRDQEQAIIDVIFRSPVLKDRPVLSPIAIHQNSGLLKTPQKILKVTLTPLVTESTMKLSEEARVALILKNKDGIYKNNEDGKMKLNDGSIEFAKEAVATAKCHGTIIISAQGTEKDKLGTPNKPTVSSLLLKLKRGGVEKIALVFVGVGIKNATDYQKEHVNKPRSLLLSKYTVEVGDCFTFQEVMSDPSVGGKFGNIDNFAFRKLNKVVPEEYK